MDESETSLAYISIKDHVISQIRSDLVSTGELELSLLNEIHETWERKMIQAGVISGTLETSSGSNPVTLHAPQDPNPLPVYGETVIDIDAKELEMFMKKGFYIPQVDGSGDKDDADIKPTTCAPYKNADTKPTTCAPYKNADTKPNTCAPYDEDDEELNENDDVEDGGGMDDDDIPNLIVCQFDHVKKKKNKTKNKWECKLKAGVMNLNGKQILFSEASGDFDF